MNCYKLSNRLNQLLNPIILSQTRFYRFGRRVIINGYYVSPNWFDQKVLNEQKNNEKVQNILNVDGIIRSKNKIFDAEKQRQKSLITRVEKIEVNLEKPFPDGEDYVLMMNANISTPFDCAAHIHQILKERSALALVDEKEYWDMHRPLTQSCYLKLLHFKHPDTIPVNHAFWRSCSMLLASVLPNAFKQEYTVEIISTPMSDLKGGSFICDVNIKNLPDWEPTKQDLQSITSLLWDETTKENIFERLEVNEEIVRQLFFDNPHRLAQIDQIIKQNPDRKQFIVYRMGQHIELSDGPMISFTKQIGSIYLSAIYPLKTSDGCRFYRFQGIAMPKQLNINSFTYSLIRDRSKKLNSFGLQQ